jgi:hypothetical protein
MASASVGSPIISCQAETGICPATIVERRQSPVVNHKNIMLQQMSKDLPIAAIGSDRGHVLKKPGPVNSFYPFKEAYKIFLALPERALIVLVGFKVPCGCHFRHPGI